ncbi:hypothetical protein BaRGS_00024791 [Batillaria attramentaria]|uniref:Uncharacterized protein n=1 Tax=Batillaria attramentaria TaxID=370345 RepID=A0ABD0KA07_9CAEN
MYVKFSVQTSDRNIFACVVLYFVGHQIRFWKKPWGVAVTTDNKVLVTDAGAGPSEGCVAVFGVDGKFMSYVATGLSMPRGIAASIMGQVFVCDQEDRCVYVFDAHKNFSLVKVLKRDAAGKYLFTSPLHVTVARNLDIVVSDSGNIIKTFTSTFQLKATYQSPFLDSEFWGVCTDPQGHVYVADWKYGIHVLSSTSNLEFGGLLKNRDAVRILEPSAVAFHSQTGQLLIGSSTAQIFTAKLY